MKTISKSSYLKLNLTLFIMCLILISILLIVTANAQTQSLKEIPRNDHDPNFPHLKQFNAGVITTYAGITPPPVFIADVTYRASNRLALGILGGTTGALGLYGVKVNASIYTRNNFAVNYRMVVVYYTKRDGKFLFDRTEKQVMPWMLSMGVADAEWKTKKGLRYSLGMGVLETHCVEGMKKYFWGDSDENKIVPFELFHTIQGSVSIPLSGKLTIRPEIITIMKSGKFIHRGDFRVSPFNPYLKFIYTFQ